MKIDRLFYDKIKHEERFIVTTTPENINDGSFYSWLVENCSGSFAISEPTYPEDGSIHFTWMSKDGFNLSGEAIITPGTVYATRGPGLETVDKSVLLKQFVPLEPLMERDVESIISARCGDDEERKKDCEFGFWLGNFVNM